MPIAPDTKDWTWVLDRPCPECGFDASSFPPEEVGSLVRTNARAWLAILAEPPEVLRRRISDDRWSPLEYGCHVRDVFHIADQRLELMLTADSPTFENWDQDRTAVDGRYRDQDPGVVASHLLEAADSVAARFEVVDGLVWDRRGLRSDGAEFTVNSFGRYMIHDPLHHLHDVTADLAKLRSTYT